MATTKPKRVVHDDDTKRAVLETLILRPRLKEAARKNSINPATLFRWIKESYRRTRQAYSAMARS